MIESLESLKLRLALQAAVNAVKVESAERNLLACEEYSVLLKMLDQLRLA